MMKKMYGLMVTIVFILSLSVSVMAGPSFEYNDYCGNDDYDDCSYDEYETLEEDCDWEDDCDYESLPVADDCDYEEDDDSDCLPVYNDCNCEENRDYECLPVVDNSECHEVCYMTATKDANVRSGPGTNYCVVGSVSEGETVGIIGEGDGWYMTKCGNFIYAGAFEEEVCTDYSNDPCDYDECESEYYDAVVISIDSQTVKVYKHGEVVCESSCVTGTEGVYDTPKGEFKIENKEEDRTLTGKDYEVEVKYWMAFHDGCGLHDGDNWRSTYGGDIYQSNGSHGCVNLPEYMAETIYKSCPVGTPVIIQ